MNVLVKAVKPLKCTKSLSGTFRSVSIYALTAFDSTWIMELGFHFERVGDEAFISHEVY
jgi:hypothetical protein